MDKIRSREVFKSKRQQQKSKPNSLTPNLDSSEEKPSSPMSISSISSIQNLDTSSFMIDNSISFSFLKALRCQEKAEIENSRRLSNLRESKVAKYFPSKNKKYQLKEGIQNIKDQYERTLSKKRSDSRETVKKPNKLPVGRNRLQMPSNRSSPEKDRFKCREEISVSDLKFVGKRKRRIGSMYSGGSPMTKRMHRRRNSKLKSSTGETPIQPRKILRLREIDETNHVIAKKEDLLIRMSHVPKKTKERSKRARRSPMKARVKMGFHLKKKTPSSNYHNTRPKRESLGQSRKGFGTSCTGLTQTFNDFLNNAKLNRKSQKPKAMSNDFRSSLRPQTMDDLPN